MDDQIQNIVANFRNFWNEYVRIGNLHARFDGTSGSLRFCTELLGSLQALNPNDQYMGLNAQQFRDMVTLGCSVYIGDIFLASNPDASFKVEVAPNGLLDEVSVEVRGESGWCNNINLLSMCIKAREDPVNHDLAMKLAPKFDGPR